MLATNLFALCLCILGGGLVLWHVIAWGEARAREQDDREFDFRRRQFRRRVQASTMIIVLGAAIAAGQLIQGGMIGLMYWATVLLVVMWLGVLALADIIATQFHYGRLRDRNQLEQTKLKAQIAEASNDAKATAAQANESLSRDLIAPICRQSTGTTPALVTWQSISMDSFYLCLAFGPLAIYLLALGCVAFVRRPLVSSGPREVMFLGAALIGLAIVGPMRLFMPEATAAYFGSSIWVLLILLYLLVVVLVALMARPRVVIYNATALQARAALEQACRGLDPEAQFAGDSVALPQLGVQLRVESFPWMRNTALVANSDEQNRGGWKSLKRALRAELAGVRTPLNPRGVTLLLAGLALVWVAASRALADPQSLARGFWEMLER